MRSGRFYLRVIIAVSFITLLLTLAYFNSEKLRRGPVIEIETPLDGASPSSPLVPILGRAQNISYLTLDGRQIYVDSEGRIKEQLLIPYGYTILSLEGRDRFGRTAQKQIRLFYK